VVKGVENNAAHCFIVEVYDEPKKKIDGGPKADLIRQEE